MKLSELSAREGIRDLVARYNSNGDADRLPQLLDLFTPTAVMEIPDETGATHRYEGRDAIMSMFSSLKVGFDESLAPGAPPHLIRHYTATHQIDLLDDHHASGRLYYAVLMAHGLDHWSRYLDTYEELDGNWLFSSRRATADGHTRRQ
jgi:hypothetical protein